MKDSSGREIPLKNLVPVQENSALDQADLDIKESFDGQAAGSAPLKLGHDREEEEKQERETKKRSARTDWEQTSAEPEEEGTAEEEYILSPEPLGAGPEQAPPEQGQDQPDTPQDIPAPVSNIIKLYSKPGQPPSPDALTKALKQAMDQGWETLYVYKGNGKSPDFEVAQYIQSFIEQNNLTDRINCCLDPEEYKACGTVKDVCKRSIENGAVPKKDISFS